MDFILNGQGHGSIAATLLASGGDPAGFRPWVGKDGRHYISRNEGGKLIAVPTYNANATLRRDEWKILDEAIISVAKERRRVVSDIRDRGLQFTIPNGMGKTIFETERVSDITPAIISMDPIRKSEADRPEYDLVGLPMPVIHKDFYFSARQVATSRNRGESIDVTSAQLAANRVMEEAERLTLGLSDTFTYGGGTIYGLTNFPERITRVITSPEDNAWTPQLAVQEILAMRQDSVDAFHYGPWMIYHGTAWDQYMDDDYSAQKGDNTLRQRIEMLSGIGAGNVRSADYLPGYQIVLVQMTSNIVRMVVGMDITTLQWETDGGMRLNFKVMAILVPQIRSDMNGNTGLVHGNVAA